MDSNSDETAQQNTKEKLYSCDVCQKSFAFPSYLTLHKRTHTNEKPYSCQLCGKSFTQKNSLNSHERIHTGEKPYTCDVCGMEFSNGSNYSRHKKNHTGEKSFVCDICQMSFSLNANLLRHKKIHTGEKPHICEVCGKPFSDIHNLIRHKKTHTGEKPFPCHVCKKTYTHRSVLLLHYKSACHLEKLGSLNTDDLDQSFNNQFSDTDQDEEVKIEIKDDEFITEDSKACDAVKEEMNQKNEVEEDNLVMEAFIVEEIKEEISGDENFVDSEEESKKLVNCSQYLQVQIKEEVRKYDFLSL